MFPNANFEIKSYSSVLVDEYIMGVLISVLGIFGYYYTYYFVTPPILQKVKIKKLITPIGLLIAGPIAIIFGLILLVPLLSWFWGYYIFLAYIVASAFSILGALKRVTRYSREKERENALLQQQNLESQLSLLKAQINPHFLFNTINNIDVLIETNPKTASQYLNKLSEILRFNLYRVDEDTILLSDEIKYITDFVDLQKIRSFNPEFVHFEVIGNTEDIKIAPMILMTFVENAFKFVSDKTKDKVIEIQIDILSDKIRFTCINEINDKTQYQSDKNSSGLGINTVRQRLNLIYKDQHILDILSNDTHFKVTLEINTK